MEMVIRWKLNPALSDIIEADPGMMPDLIAIFVTDSTNRLRSLSFASVEGNLKAIRAQAHSLKGSALQIGAPGLAALCAALELAESPRRDESERMISGIQDEFILVCKTMEGHLSELLER
ncbi:MAG TPA: Hpt domain-containing protein [Bryobacteraceae bacterium]|nr:Hpt domain-containing protein [Bryobacteraceae bacterium]